MNLARVSEDTQKTDELPSQFHDQLCVAYHQYTSFNPEAPENWSMINTNFVQQSASDVCRKLQKMDGFVGANIDQIISIAAKVVAKQEEMAKREMEKYLEKKAKILVMASRRQMGRPEARREAPTGENGETPQGKTSVPTVRKRGIGKMSALTRKKKRKRKSDSGCSQIQGSLQPRDKHSLGR
jgi:hypothetical protein